MKARLAERPQPLVEVLVWIITIAGVVVVAGCGAVAGVVRIGVATPFPGGGRLMVASGHALLVPPTDAGWVGWCMVEGAGESEGGMGSCAATRPVRRRPYLPIIAESWGGGGPPWTTEGSVVVEASVRELAFDGVRIPIPKNPALPFGLRGVAVKLAGRNLMGRGEIPKFDLIGRDARTEHPMPLAVELPSKTLSGEHSLLHGGVCEITAGRRGLPTNAHVVSQAAVNELRLRPAIAIGHAFTSCVDVEYLVNHFQLTEGALLYGDGANAAPALPDMRPLRGDADIYTAPGEAGTMLLRREGHAWLYVVGDSHSRALCVRALRALRVNVR